MAGLKRLWSEVPEDEQASPSNFYHEGLQNKISKLIESPRCGAAIQYQKAWMVEANLWVPCSKNPRAGAGFCYMHGGEIGRRRQLHGEQFKPCRHTYVSMREDGSIGCLRCKKVWREEQEGR